MTEYIDELVATTKQKSYADKLIDDIEKEYKNLSKEPEDREKEKKELGDRLREVKSKLKKTKNVRGVNHRAANEAQAEKRRKLRQEMKDIEDQLSLIEMEEEGTTFSTKAMLDKQLVGQ